MSSHVTALCPVDPGRIPPPGPHRPPSDPSTTTPDGCNPLLRDAADSTVEPLANSDLMAIYASTPTGFIPAGRAMTIGHEIRDTGTYRHTSWELSSGARVAWRNSTACVGKSFWRALQVEDARHLTTPESVFAAIVSFLDNAYNGGHVLPLMLVLAPDRPDRPGPRIWNSQLISYAGYVCADGTVLGDPNNAALTRAVIALGWEPPRRTAFDVLPIVVAMPGEPPRLFELPPDVIHEVPIVHPSLPFERLGLRWYAFPAIANMRLEIAGVSYPAAPFTGFYTGAEIGGRNLSDTNRYNMLRPVADIMALDTSSDRTLWKDRALVELNAAVLYSFDRAGVKIFDHHMVCRHFARHERLEREAGRETPVDWRRIIPALSPATTPVFHRYYRDEIVTPNFFAQPEPWQ